MKQFRVFACLLITAGFAVKAYSQGTEPTPRKCMVIEQLGCDSGNGFCTAPLTICEDKLREAKTNECGHWNSSGTWRVKKCKTYTVPIDPLNYLTDKCASDHPGFTKIFCGGEAVNCCFISNAEVPSSESTLASSIMEPTGSLCNCP